jgi:RNA polymerase sporulation-specific sigma factor
VIASEELESLVSCLSGTSGVLSDLESRVLSLYLDGHSYEATAERLECDTKTVDNACSASSARSPPTSTHARCPPS